jgi:hypothetical protein
MGGRRDGYNGTTYSAIGTFLQGIRRSRNMGRIGNLGRCCNFSYKCHEKEWDLTNFIFVPVI